MRNLARAAFSIGLLLGIAPAQAADPTTVFAAASLKNALDEAGKAFTAQSGVPVRASYAASSALARQIEQGAPADLFASADLEWMDYLAARKLIRPETRVNLLNNRLVVVAPKAAQASTAPMARPPRKRPITPAAKSNSALLIPPCVAKCPIRMKSGMTDRS